MNQTPIDRQPSPVDKDLLYGRYHDSTDERTRVQNERLRWQNQLSKQVAHKALDEPLLEEDAMHVDARRSTRVTNTGLGWKELLLIASLGLPALGTAGLAGAGLVAAVLQTPAAHEDADTRTIPRLRFGPERQEGSE